MNPSTDAMRGTHNANVSRRRLVAAITSTLADHRGAFVLGAVRYILMVRPARGQGCSVGVLLDNLHFSPAAFAADLLSPFRHVWVAWEPELVLRSLEPALSDLDAHRPALLSTAFGMAEWWRELTGSEASSPVGLSALAEGLDRRGEGHLAQAWVEAGQSWAGADPWGAARPVREEVDTLAELLHVGSMGERARVNVDFIDGGEAWRSKPGSLFRYNVPVDWWERMVALVDS